MNAIMNEKGRQTKLLAAIAIIAMVVCALAVVLPSENVEAAEPPTEVSTAEELNAAIADSSVTEIKLTTNVTADSVSRITNKSIDLNGCTLTTNNHIRVNNSTITNGTVSSSYSGNGVLMLEGKSPTITELDITRTVDVPRSVITVAHGTSATITACDIVKTSNDPVAVYFNGTSGTSTIENCNFGSNTDGVRCVNVGDVTKLTIKDSGKIDLNVMGSDNTISVGTSDSNGIVLSKTSIAILQVDKADVTIDDEITVESVWNYGTLNIDGTLNATDFNNSGTLNVAGTVTSTNAPIGDGTVIITDPKASVPESFPVSGASISDPTQIVAAFELSNNVVYTGSTGTSGNAVDITIPELKNNQSLTFGNEITSGYFNIKIGSSNIASFTDFDAVGLVLTSGSLRATATSMGGTIAAHGDVVDLDTQLSKNLTLEGPKSYVVPSNGELDLNDKKLIISEDVTLRALGPITGTGSIEIQKGATLSYTEIANTVTIDNKGGTIKIEGGQGTENIISVSQSVNGTYYLTADTTILNGVTFTVPRNAVLNLMGYDLIVEGTLVIENRGTVTNGVGAVDTVNPDDNSIILTTTGSIQNEGTIGDRMPINISNGANEAESQVVSMKGVTGVSIQLVRTIEGTDRVYNMAVSGDVSAVRGVDAPSITLTNVDINKSMTIADDITITIAGITDVLGNGTVFTLGDAKMIIDDATNSIDGTFTLYDNGTSAVLNGHVVGKIDVNVGKVSNENGQLEADVAEPAASVTFTDSNTTNNVGSYMVGMTISAKRVTVPVEDGDAQIYQRMFVNGELKAVNDKKEVSEPAGIIAFGGNVYIAETLAIPEHTTVNAVMDGSYTLMVSEGGVVSAVENQGLDYNGVRYEVDGEKATDPSTFYYTDFATAMEALATTADETIYLDGKFTITGTYTVGADLAIESLNDVLTEVTVGEGAVITVDAEGYVSPVAFMKIEGKVTALEGEGYLPSDSNDIYAVKAVDEETLDTTYSGFKTAMDEAQAGQTIEVVGSAEYDGDLVIPNGVTVQVNEGLTLTVTGDVTIENGGKLVLDASTLAVGEITENGTTYTASENVITVAGELDASEAGTISAVTGHSQTADVDVYSTGTLTSMTAVGGNGITMNAAYYQDGEYVYTSLANAVAYAEESDLPTPVHVTGIFTETGAVESDGVSIVVDNGANVTLGDITLNNAKISSAAATSPAVQGTYTATITALNGAGDAAADATVAVSKTTATVESKVTLNAEGTSQYRLTIDTLAGANVQAGTVTYIGGDVTVDARDNGFTVSSGATLLMDGANNNTALTVSGQGSIVNNGTIQVAEDKTLTISGTIPGAISVPADATLVASANGAVITGTVTVDAEGAFNVAGELQVGAQPELLTDTTTGTVVGEVTLNSNANTIYILAFAGADLSQADIVLNGDVAAELKNTAYQINGIDFATVYTFGNKPIDGTHGDAVYDAVDALKDLYTPNTVDSDDNIVYYDIVWYADGTEVIDETVGEYATVNTEIRYNTVDIVVSAGPAITVSIDGVVWNGWNPTSLTIGTHTVSAVVNPGYTGTIQITFNGVAVTNGQFEITSDMLNSIEDIVLSASGNITQDSTVVVDGGSSGSGEMGLTDYLLIILVILIVVMAIIVGGAEGKRIPNEEKG